MSSEPAKPIGGLFPELYKNTKDVPEQSMVPGTLLPPSRARAMTEGGTGEAGVGYASNILGAQFDLQKPVAHNIVEFDDDGGMTTTPFSVAATEILKKRNHQVPGQVLKPISLKEAIRLAAGGTPAAASAASVPAAPHTDQSMESASSPAATPRILVKFECSFGKFAVIFNRVFRDVVNPHLLVLEQYGPEGLFFEAPQIDTPIIVRYEGNEYSCVPATFFTLPDGLTRYTVLCILEAPGA